MALNRLSTTAFNRIKPKSRRFQVSDGGGLALWVYPNGKKTWIFRFRRPCDGAQDYLTLGSLGLEDARKQRDKYARLLHEGIDPKLAQYAETEQNASVMTMNELVDYWLEFITETRARRRSTIEAHRWRWDKYLMKSLGKIRLPDLTRKHVAIAIDRTRLKGKRQASLSLTTVNLVLDFAMARHLIDINPARVLKPKDFDASPNPPRERFLDLDELTLLWSELDRLKAEKHGKPPAGKLARTTVAVVQLLIATGARVSEVTKMQRAELDLDRHLWRLPEERSKNGRLHLFWLSPLAVGVLKDALAGSRDSPYVFKSYAQEDGPILNSSVSHALKRACARSATIEHFTLHDLRRSAATGWAEHLKTPPHVIERMLNHRPENRLVETYQRATYQEEQRSTWLGWGRLLTSRLYPAANGEASNDPVYASIQPRTGKADIKSLIDHQDPLH